MGVFDKLKNALFEEEYYEVEEKPKKKKVEKTKVKTNNKPIAKKVILPEKKEKVEEIEEEDLTNDDFEFRPKDDFDKEELVNRRSSFKILEDDDLIFDDNVKPKKEELKIEPVVEKKVEVQNNDVFDFRDEKDLKEVEYSFNDYKETKEINTGYSFDGYKEKKEKSSGYSFEKPAYSSKPVKEKNPYGIDKSTEIHVSDYGSYERYEDKTVFRPTPVISPIYGVLDKNYKKDDIIQKKGVRLSSSFTRSNVSIDEIRQKAYGKKSVENTSNFLEDEFEQDLNNNSNSFEINQPVEEDLLVDLTEADKPEVKEVTMGDAVEYFEELGLEYNVDYVDQKKSNERIAGVKEVKTPKRVTPEIDILSEVKIIPERKEVVKKEEKVEKITTKNEELDNDSDDNLFDLIDSMYQE